jgi:hypothetical protein
MDLKITNFRPSTSASPSIIGTGTCNGLPAFFKIFYDGENPLKRTIETIGLSYELEIYKYILNYPDDITKYYIKLLHYVNKTTLQNLINDHIIINPHDVNLNKRIHETNITFGSSISIIITEDTNSEPLFDMRDISKSYIYKYTDTYVGNYNYIKKRLNNIFDLVISGIKTLNNTLKIQHNDMHFANILIKKENLKYITNENNTLNSDYKISIFDFDRAYLEGHDNPFLDSYCIQGRGCNSLSNKDYYMFIQSILEIIIEFQKTHLHNFLCEYLTNLFNALVPENFRDLLKTHMKKSIEGSGPHWFSYCFHKVGNSVLLPTKYPCDDPKIQDIYMEWLSEIPEKFNHYVSGDLEYSYLKKYLKYKNKYLQLKNKKLL